MIKIITEGDKTYAMVSVPPNYWSGHISRTGNSLVYRVEGEYLCANGEVKGEKGKYSPYINRRLPFSANLKGQIVSKSDIVKFDFDGLISPAVKILKA